ncbi:MAG: hypothetical protein LN413_02600 [Candidatus Thermoplasmatota archaeon]|nr:hypothetical protein [Candidatus Thermoplasmatota archaeon]
MVYVWITHAVEDFSKRVSVYDAYRLEPSNLRSKGDMVFQSAEDLNLVTVLAEFESREDADLMISAEELKDAMPACIGAADRVLPQRRRPSDVRPSMSPWPLLGAVINEVPVAERDELPSRGVR